MASAAEKIGNAFFNGVFSGVLLLFKPFGIVARKIISKAADAKNIRPLEGTGLDKFEDIEPFVIAVLERYSAVGGKLATNPVFLGLASVLLAPLIVGPIAAALNERTILRPLRAKVRPETLQAVEVITAWRRKEFSPTELRRRLDEIGFPFDDQEALIRITEVVPGAQDIIRFAVREVYDPVQRAALDLDAEIEPVLKGAAKDLEIAALPEETLRKFWAAHWVLPSVGQAFEMRHREVIDDVGLRSILKALDIAPVWRSRLEDIAFTPFTRVDIRRMFKAGILDDLGVFKAYKDIGYDEEKSLLQVEFVKAIAGDPTTDEETFSDREALKARDLTRGDVVGAFEDGLITRPEADQALEGLGYAAGERSHILARAEFKVALDESKKSIRNLENGFVRGALDEVFVRSFMGRLGLPAAFIDGKVREWELIVESNTALPTKAEILRWFGKELIDEITARDALRRTGLATKWIDVMLRERTPLPEEEV